MYPLSDSIFRQWIRRLLPLLVFGALEVNAAAEPLRITALQRCDDLLATRQLRFCLHGRGLEPGELKILLEGKPLRTTDFKRKGQSVSFSLSAARAVSGALWLEQGRRSSNPVWLTVKNSQVRAAAPDAVMENMDGLETYTDLVSVIIEERYDGLQQARLLASKYGAEVVGAIPPLNVYQLRLPVADLTERDAMILRIDSEAMVDAVVIEETAPEPLWEGEAARKAEPDALDDGEWIANRFLDAVNYYRRRIPFEDAPIETTPVRIGVIERNVDFDAPDFSDYLGACGDRKPRTCVYATDGPRPDDHGTTVAGILAARWDNGGNTGFLRGLDGSGPGFQIIVERNSDAGITANVAASVNLVEDGVRVLNWSWGIHRVGTRNIQDEEVDSLVRSGLAMSGYEELLEEFFRWLRSEHPDVIVINSAGNGASRSGSDDYRLPSSFITDQLLVVGGHQRGTDNDLEIDDPHYAVKRSSSNLDVRVDITAAACARGSTPEAGERGERHCGTSYATPMVTAVVAAMLSINPELEPEQLRMLLRRSAMPIGASSDFEPADAEDLTAPILPSERSYELDDRDVGHSARLDMQKALILAVKSRDRVR